MGEKECVTFSQEKVYDFQLEKTLDEKVLLKKLEKSVEKGTKASLDLKVGNTDRSFGTILGAEITRQHKDGLPEDTITINCTGAGGQSFGAFIPKGLTLRLCGDTNDYYGKGLSGGKLVVFPPKNRGYKAEENIIWPPAFFPVYPVYKIPVQFQKLPHRAHDYEQSFQSDWLSYLRLSEQH